MRANAVSGLPRSGDDKKYKTALNFPRQQARAPLDPEFPRPPHTRFGGGRAKRRNKHARGAGSPWKFHKESTTRGVRPVKRAHKTNHLGLPQPLVLEARPPDVDSDRVLRLETPPSARRLLALEHLGDFRVRVGRPPTANHFLYTPVVPCTLQQRCFPWRSFHNEFHRPDAVTLVTRAAACHPA